MKSVTPWLAGIAIIGSLAWLAYWYKTQPVAGEPEMHMAPIACEACGKAYGALIGKEPALCYFCKQPKAWRAQQCVKCKAVVPMVGHGTPSFESSAAKCPKCNGTRFSEVAPNAVQIVP